MASSLKNTSGLDIFSLQIAARPFDHVFVCFVLKQLPQLAQALAALRRLLEPGGTLVVIEGGHGLVIFTSRGPCCTRSDTMPRRFADGLREPERTTGPDGMFGYTFFKAVSRGPSLSAAPTAGSTWGIRNEHSRDAAILWVRDHG